MARPLYLIRADILALNDTLDELEGDLSRCGELEAAVTATLDALAEEQAEKLDSYVGLVRQLRMEATAARAEREQWEAKEKARTARADYLEARLKAHLEATGQPKVSTASGRLVRIVKNGGVQPVAIRPGTTPADVPADFHRVTIELDRAAIRAALVDGQELSFAELLPRGTHLKVS